MLARRGEVSENTVTGEGGLATSGSVLGTQKGLSLILSITEKRKEYFPFTEETDFQWLNDLNKVPQAPRRSFLSEPPIFKYSAGLGTVDQN